MKHASKKIYITSLHLKHGGVENVITSLANAFSEQGAEVEILCTYQLGEPAYELNRQVKVTYLTDVHPNRTAFQEAIKGRRLLSIVREGLYALKVLRLKKKTMKRAIKSISDGIVIATRNEHAILLSKYGGQHVKKIAQLHHDHAFDKKLIHAFQTKYQHIDYFLLLTPQTTAEVQGFMKGHNTHTVCCTVPNFLDKLYNGPWPQRKNQIITVGRLSPEKGFERLLDIWKMAREKLPDWELKIIGDGQERVRLEEKAKALGISDSVCFAGLLPHEAVLAEMADSKIYAMTSYTESFGLVIAEAQSCRLPVVAFDVRVGPRAIITDGVDGYLVQDRDSEAFCRKLTELASSEGLRQTVGNKAAENANRFEREQVLKLWGKVL